MSAQRIAGWVTVISGAGLLVLLVISSVAGIASNAGGWTSPSSSVGVPGMGMMGGGYGMMGGGPGPAMMRSHHGPTFECPCPTPTP